MKLFFISIFIGLAIVLMVKDHPGYVLINYPPWVMETALPVFAVMLILAYFAVNYAVRIISTFLFVREKWGSWQKRRLGLRAQASLAQGLMKNWAGRWTEAEKLLTRSANDSAYPALHLLAAAHAAQQQGSPGRRDRYLNLAKKHLKPTEWLALELNRADWLMESGQYQDALDQLRSLQPEAPKNLRLNRMLAQCYYRLKDWEKLVDLLKILRDQKMVNEPEFDLFEVNAHYQLLDQKLAEGDHVAVANAWIKVPMRLREHENLLPLYVRSLMEQGEVTKAEQMLYSAIKRHRHDRFIELYGLLQTKQSNKQLQRLEGWLNQRPKDQVLLQAAARVCLHNKLWGKARSYLEAAIGIAPTEEMYKELGDLLELIGETQAAVECFRQGLQLAVTHTVTIDATPEEPEYELLKDVTSAPSPLPGPGAEKLLAGNSKK